MGWKEKAPFDAIIATACAAEIPYELTQQLKIGGKLIIPIENNIGGQELIKIIRTQEDFIIEKILDVKFVPMTEK